jgi:amino acid adenylation domain-containing protein
MNKSNVADIYPLSPMQQGMLFHALLDADVALYWTQFTCALRGQLEVERFKQAVQLVVAIHPTLRTAFVWENREKPLQVVRAQVTVPWEEQDWRRLAGGEQEKRWLDYLQEDRQRRCDLSKAPLMRLALLRRGDDDYQFVWSHHHLLLDGWSLHLVLKDVFSAYEALVSGRHPQLSSPRPYRDYIAWLQQQDLSAAEAFWRNFLKGFSAPTPLIVERASPSPGGPEDDYRVERATLPHELRLELQAAARQHRLTVNTLLQGAWALLLSRYSGEPDVTFGVTVSGRPAALPAVESMVGLFINTVPLRVPILPHEPVSAWLQALQARQVEIQQYEFTPLVRAQGWSDVPRGQPLFHSILVFENYPVDPQWKAQPRPVSLDQVRSFERTNYPLTVVGLLRDDLVLQINFEARRFDEQTIQRMLGHLRTLLEQMVSRPAARLRDLVLLTPEERRQLLKEWNRASVFTSPNQCVHHRFEVQVERTPDAIAVVCEGQQLTYRELNVRANQLSHFLRSRGVGPEVMVGICLDRTLELVIGLLGILKAGGAYVPLDLSYPRERVAFMLSDCQAPLVITQQRLAPDLTGHTTEVVCLDQHQEEITNQPTANPSAGAGPEHLAYVIYTSGSTGKPKGSLITHYNVVRLFDATQRWFNFDERDVWTLFHSYAFDFSVWEIWGALFYGGRLVVVPYLVSRSPEAFYRLLCGEHVTVLNQTPSAFRQLSQAEELVGQDPRLALRYVVFGGEALELQSLKPWFDRHGDEHPQLVNMYGITETTVHVTYRPIRRDDLSSGSVIGVPIPDLQIYLVDENQQLVPIGVPGEIHVGGAGLGRGYLRRPELTDQKFIPNPFSTDPQARLYRSGDLARYQASGDLEYLGRIDHQVKIRGFRIELGEIESVLNQLPGVRESVVVLREDAPGDKRLAAYLVATELPAPDQLRQRLRQQLPEYMIPTTYVRLDRLPLTGNGKVDRRALPVPPGDRSDVEDRYVAPRNATEELLARIWSEVLRVKRVGIHDDFFELGGDSLIAVRGLYRIRESLQVELPLRMLFENQTVATLALAVTQQKAEGTDAAELARLLAEVETLSDAEAGSRASVATKRSE